MGVHGRKYVYGLGCVHGVRVCVCVKVPTWGWGLREERQEVS